MHRFDDQLGLRFDTVAERYHRVRPRYPDAIWDALFELAGLRPGARVLEIGAGTGIATAELVRRGCHVTALEPGPDMAAIIVRDLGGTGQVDVVVGTFDDFVWDGEPFDLAIGATSLHWVDRETLNTRLPTLVKPGGHVALLHYLHVAGGDQAFFDAVQACDARWDPNYWEPGYPEHHLRSPDDPSHRAAVLDGLSGFAPAEHRYWLVATPSDRQHYLSLISTYSTTLRLPEDNRLGLFACIGELMDREFGGQVTKRYRFDLVVRERESPGSVRGQIESG
jgi:SAM-dependent methyltransferase